MSNSSIKIRPVHHEDARALYEIISDPRVNSTLLQLPSMEFSATEEWMNNKKAGQHRLVAEIDGSVAGSATLAHNQRPRLQHSGSIGLMVAHDYWGRGVASALMQALLDLADNWLNLYRVELAVFTDNPAAIHLYKKFDFTVEGTRREAVFGGDGRFHDKHVMARLHRTSSLSSSPTAAAEPIRPERRQPPSPVTIRPQHPDDTEDLYEIFRLPAVGRTTLQLPSQEISRVRNRAESTNPNIHRLVAVVDGRVVGSVNIYQHTRPRTAHVADLGMMVHPDYWGMGIGSRLMEGILDIADNWLHLRRVELAVNSDNPPAVKLYEKFGFEIEGTKRFHTYGDGRWAHSHFMGRLREDQD